MKEFIDFVREYGLYLLGSLCFVIEVIVILIKRKPKSIDDFKLALTEALSIVPELVISRERPGEGELKKKEVLISCKKLIERRLGRGLSSNESLLVDSAVDTQIETVLSTPTKKEK